MRPIVIGAAERLSRPELLRKTWRKGQLTPYLFPYAHKYENTELYKDVCASVKKIVGCTIPRELSPCEPFNSCKRILRVIAPQFGDDLEFAEGESRMIGSLFLAALFALVLALRTRWLIPSAFATILLGYGFRKYREREVRYGYPNFTIATSATIRDYIIRPTPSSDQK
ncbi:MAG: hypothetical protein ABSG56_34885 [Bryobacteraceae bacterium]